MRKEYFKPRMKVMELGAVDMLAASAPRYEYRGFGQNKSDDTDGSADEWGNLWNR